MTFEQVSPIGHTASISTLVLAFAGWLSPVLAGIGSILVIVWYIIVIYESRTFQHWHRNRQMVKKARKVAKLRAREKVILAELDALETVRAARVEARDMVAHAKADAGKLIVTEATAAVEKLPPI